MTKEFLEKLGITGENADAIIKQAEQLFEQGKR